MSAQPAIGGAGKAGQVVRRMPAPPPPIWGVGWGGAVRMASIKVGRKSYLGSEGTMARKLTDRLALLEGAPEQSRVNIICRRIIGDDGIPDGTEYRTTIIPGQPPKRDVLNSAGLGVIDNG